MGEFSGKFLLLKYFLHGILFSGIFLAMAFIWAIIFVVLIAFGSFIGLILGFIVFFFIISGINVFLADLIWSIPVKSDWKSLLVHGFVLFILLIIVSIPSLVVNLIVPSLITTIILFIIYCFIDGFVAKA
jgi:hypothetical protein